MRHSRHIHHASHTFVLSYPLSLSHRLYTIVLGPLLIVALMYVIYSAYPVFAPHSSEVVSFSTMAQGALYTLGRITVAYIFSLIFAVPLALLAISNKTLEALLLPVFDVMESIPILAVFPLVIVVFLQFNFLNGAAIFILFLNMLWNIVFALVGGLKIIPKDIGYVAHVFGLRGFSYIRKLILPAVFPQLVTGSILAVADGWNIIIVAEALHSYMPGGTPAQDLFGIGSILVSAAANAQNGIFLTAVLIMVVMIAFINFFVWQKLLHYSQRFRFE
ncbi:MAG: Binding-protein-dependent transport system inner membrane component [Candidatus Kaiserbacteria bacterium GW2011_GWB1_52_6]|uniref:Binding-protein-dependent transport system inner membrane component n=3 Tax=Candidatus Kaiseribacteriota TaxID=1752734 RepID=A0A0G1XHE8_9BACT|nr:MAG: Binding-protein-dependent transport system inner membrane component [Candidatus Kaiserbacteria bacterium GW2011_GWA2_52_12]KKW27009.1 MAG: Binding-protein-dependent transport system inner membrane component [Candidatus Kaiserbacteria bacterium GW2011_GWB1_52_6]KKW30335.1 MAG: Binding-protein-dependent transport system inner membrane component [Candidatus Kaiserbacteria bacterium GW2011_GWC2_52_8b]